MSQKKEIMRQIGNVSRCFTSIANIEFKEYHLAKNQYIYLVRICENPGIIMEKLCEEIKVDKSTASRSINKLCDHDFIYKNKSENNNKNLKLYPTNKGLEIYELLKAEEVYSDNVALQGFSNEELKLLQEYMNRITSNVNNDWELVKKGGKRAYK